MSMKFGFLNRPEIQFSFEVNHSCAELLTRDQVATNE